LAYSATRRSKKAPVEGGDAHAGATSDVLEGHLETALGERRPCGLHDPSAVALGIDPKGFVGIGGSHAFIIREIGG
jgi:hypothetical protein